MGKFLKKLECPICMEYMIPPITVCLNGHSICNSCKPRLDNCPSCRGNFTPIRNRDMEDISQEITHPCKNRDQGCAVHVLLDFKKQHEEECNLSPCMCPLRDVNLPWMVQTPGYAMCSWVGPLSALETHLQNDHKVIFEIHSQRCIPMNEGATSIFCFHIYGNFTPIRMLELEDFSDTITHPCKNRKNGCTVHVLVDFKEQHEKECTLAPCMCPLKDIYYVLEFPVSTESLHYNLSDLKHPLAYLTSIIRLIPQIPMGKHQEIFLESLKCPFCLEYKTKPITVCENGHSICNSCKPRFDKCPTCRGNFTPIRMLELEDFSDTITHPCKNRKNGCTVHVLVDFKEQHEKECTLAPCMCPLKDIKLPWMVKIAGYMCSWIGPRSALFTHLQNEHRVLFHIPPQLGFLMIEGTVGVYTFLIDGKFFFCLNRLVNSYFGVMVMFLERQEKANSYKYKVTIKSKDDEQFMSMCLPCLSITSFFKTANFNVDGYTAEFSSLLCQKFSTVVNGTPNIPFNLEIIESEMNDI
ncbi:hypothetical protein C0J52_27237 [Blattella germanica]|nr:hypothetical protein C0J52_27237 [Blattella germanica]